MIKKTLSYIILILLLGCGFKPLYKEYDVSNLTFKQINYSGNNELVYLLKNNLNLKEQKNYNGHTINLIIRENFSSADKNTQGITTNENLTISIILNVKDGTSENLIYETFEESARLFISNNLSEYDTKKQLIKNELSKILAQKIKFRLMILENQNKKK